MARAGRVIRRKANGNGGRKRKARSKEDDVDDEDEEYVLGEDDAVESDSDCESDADSRDFSDEGSFEFSESDDDDDEEKEIKIVRSKKKKNQRNHQKSRVSDDEIEDLNLSVPKRRGRAGPKKQKTKDSDYELDDDDDDDEEFLPDEDDFEEDDVLIVSKRKGGVKKERSKLLETKKRKRRNRMMEESDDDFIATDRVLVGRKRAKRKKTANKKRSSLVSESLDSDFGTSDDDFVLKHNIRRKDVNKVKKTAAGSKLRRRKTAREDSELSDSDFVISDDSDGDDFHATGKFVLEEQQKNAKKVKKTVGSNGRKKKKPTKKSVSSDSDFVISEEDDDDFDVNDQVVVYKQQMNSKKEKNMVSNKKRMRNRSSMVMESSDSDYLIYDDDDDEFVVDEQRKKSKQLRETRTKPKRTRRRSSSLVDSGSESFDFDDVISEEEVRDLGVGGGVLSLEKAKRLVVGRKGEEKGKEKQANDLGLQVCGICLSEEKKSVVQGLLNCCFHYFCFACIMEWSKVESRCPVCKRRFETITKSGGSDPSFGMRNAVIRVQKRDQVYQPPEEELRGMLDPYENVVCMECQQGGDDNLMLLCDICDSSAHTYCVGLGREVPEGNWYCECCRSVNDGPSHSQFHDIMRDQVVGTGNLLHCINERGGLNNLNVNMSSPRSVSVADRSSSLRIDLNSSPRDFPGDDHFVSSPATGSGASTVSGRRHIRQRIRIILSTNRQRQTAGGINMVDATSAANVARNGEPLPLSENRSPLSSVLSSEQWQQNPRPSFQSHTNLAPCMSIEGCSLRHVDGAKEEVQQMVKSHLKDLSRNRLMERSTFKKIARTSTHTILAACGIEHDRSMVSAAIEPPETCAHDTHDGPAHLLKSCCLSCFSSFVKDVVQRLVSMY